MMMTKMRLTLVSDPSCPDNKMLIVGRPKRPDETQEEWIKSSVVLIKNFTIEEDNNI